jgi:hypothetical protein
MGDALLLAFDLADNLFTTRQGSSLNHQQIGSVRAALQKGGMERGGNGVTHSTSSSPFVNELEYVPYFQKSRFEHLQDMLGEAVLDFPMPRDGLGHFGERILVPIVPLAVTHKGTSRVLDAPDEFLAFHPTASSPTR